jgi:DNA-binding MarR family transcriptional regulator
MARDRDDSLSESFWGVARRLRHLSKETLAPWDISPSHSRALSVLLRNGSMRLSDLSDRLRIAPRSTTEFVDVLEDRGLVERQADLHDRRATLVVLTDEGRRVGEAIQSARTAEAERFFGELSATDRAHLARILGKLSVDPPPSD